MRILMLCLLNAARPLVAAKRRQLSTRRSAAIGDYVALPASAADGLKHSAYKVTPVQAAVWAGGGQQVGVRPRAHGLGKTLAMVLPVVASTLWAGRGNPGRVVVLVPTRVVAQHETLLNALGAATAVVVGDPRRPAAQALADAIEASAVVLATPAELCQVLEPDRRAARCGGFGLWPTDLSCRRGKVMAPR